MPRRAALSIALGLLSTVTACAPPSPPRPPVKPAVAPSVGPVRVGTMICRSSVDGRPAKCGTPNAVMVGMKF